MADRYAIFFLPLTMIIAGAAWAISGDAVRALAVFVVATPCPLILAAPIALMSGLSRAARAGVVVKGATTIERLGGTRSVLLDKTGTVTLGHPELDRVVTTDGVGPDEALRLAASVDRLSAHPLAKALVDAAERRDLALTIPHDVEESFGNGVRGTLDGHRVLVGRAGWLRSHGIEAILPPGVDGGDAKVMIAVDGRLAGIALVGDRLRADSHDLVQKLREVGVRYVALATGDKLSVASASVTGWASIGSTQSRRLSRRSKSCAHCASSRNCGPSSWSVTGSTMRRHWRLADVGVAMGSAGATVSSETADAVVLVDRVDRVADAIKISRRALHIARQSVLVGLALSLAAMGVAAAGYLPPVEGALLQEAIDVGVILNALRALTG